MSTFGSYVLLSTLLVVQTFFRKVLRIFQELLTFFPIPVSCMVSQLQSVHARILDPIMCTFGTYVLLSTLLEVQTFFRIAVRLFQKLLIFFPIPLSCMVSQLESMHTRSYNVHIWSLHAHEHTSRGSKLPLNSCGIFLVNLEFLSYSSIFHGFIATVCARQIL